MEMDDIIIDINKAKDAGAILSAMALALTIPDMCAGDKSNRNDYIAWYNKYVNNLFLFIIIYCDFIILPVNNLFLVCNL